MWLERAGLVDRDPRLTVTEGWIAACQKHGILCFELPKTRLRARRVVEVFSRILKSGDPVSYSCP
jgi:hypothetical protein